jgi:hypothetical protein
VRISACEILLQSGDRWIQFLRLCKDLHKRSNWIHIGGEEAGPRVAAIVSVVETCYLKLQSDGDSVLRARSNCCDLEFSR